MPARAAFSPSRAASWCRNEHHSADVHSIPVWAFRWRHEVRGVRVVSQSVIRAVSCPSSFRTGASAGRLHKCLHQLHDAYALQTIPEGAAPRVVRNMRAIQRLAGSKHDARAHLAQGLCPKCHHTLACLWNFATTLMLQPGSHYPKLC